MRDFFATRGVVGMGSNTEDAFGRAPPPPPPQWLYSTSCSSEEVSLKITNSVSKKNNSNHLSLGNTL